MEHKKILITGASGFIGSTIVDKALELGFETWAGIRASSSKYYLQDERIKFIDLNYADKKKLKEQLRSFVEKNGRFDYIVHSAGITKAVRKSEFDKVNYEQVRNFADALVETNAVPDMFIFMSTLGAMGVGDEINYTPLPCDCTPNPNTAYGKSKLKAENYLKKLPGFPYVILRPTGVYGPRDKDYLILMRAVKNGMDVGAGFRKQVLTFIYIDDLVKIVFDCIEKNISRKEYYVADGDIYTDTEFNTIVQQALQKKRVFRIKVPLWIVKPATFVSEKIFRILGKPTTFNTDKYLIMRQRNWSCDITPLQRDLDFVPDYRLKEGVEKTVKWYKKHQWL
ncbi:MAG: NAD(P)-dependent oxidoreductase [Bacteroidia bacterium]|nr:NAD(P)-dependent oxidoreductase [Bacteroidia bacterium]